MFKVHPCCSMYLYFIPFYCLIIFYCVDIPFYLSIHQLLDIGVAFFSFLAIMNDIALNMCVHGFVWMFFIPLSTYLGGTVPLFGYRLLILIGIWFACCSLRWLLFYGLKESKDLFISFYVERERRRER